MKRCKWCGDEFHPKHGNQKYCGELCASYAHQEQKTRWMFDARKNGKYKQREGVGRLGSTPASDFDEEYNLIQQEKKRLKLRV